MLGKTRGRFAKRLLRELSLPTTNNNILSLVGWMDGENTYAKWNPLATTQPWNNATNFNSVGVKNYASMSDGIKATAKTLTNGYYKEILRNLNRSAQPLKTGEAIAASPWGTKQLAIYGIKWALDHPRKAKSFPLNQSRVK